MGALNRGDSTKTKAGHPARIGFKFSEYNGESLLLTIKQALQAFRDQTSWQVLMRNGMNKDFSWSASAREYGKVYDKVRQIHGAPAAAEKVLA
jgi:starch synthase